MNMRWLTAGVCLLACSGGNASGWRQADATAVPAAPGKVRVAYFIDPQVFHGATLLRAPAAQDPEGLAEVHRTELARTPGEVSAAQYDDTHEDIFVYGSVVGEAFRAGEMPLTAALSAHIRNDSGVVNAPLKAMYGRRRPYQIDKTLHAVCKTDMDSSYPSGHAMVGYLMGLTVAQMVPEKAGEILARADAYARNRVVCGVHYPSDVAASRSVAYAMFGYLLGTPRFEKELAAATVETRRRLGLGELAVW